MMQYTGKMLLILGAFLMLAGLVVLLLGSFSGIGKLPGDIVVRRENFTFYFPITTSILVSLVLSFVLYFVSRR